MIDRYDEIRERVRKPDDAERRNLRDALAAIARPRLTGSSGATETEAELRGRFEKLGYDISEMRFDFSAWPGRFGVPVLGAVYVIGIIVATWLVAAEMPIPALVVLLVVLLLVAALAGAAPWLMRKLPWGRVETANWLVHRPSTSPRLLVMAHRDTKSQLVPILLRALSGGAAVFGWVAMAFLAVLELSADIELSGVAVFVGVAAAAMGVPLLLSWAGNTSPGALDNGTGLAVLLGLAERMKDDGEIAFLVTDGEEMGLVGARAAARQLPPVEGILNVDGIDDRGPFLIMERHGYPRRGAAPHLATSLFTSARLLDLPVERRDLPLGIHVDHIPLVQARMPSLTLMRGSTSSLWRVHLPSDSTERTTGSGVADAVALIEGALHIRRTPFGSTEGTLPEGLRGA